MNLKQYLDFQSEFYPYALIYRYGPPSGNVYGHLFSSHDSWQDWLYLWNSLQGVTVLFSGSTTKVPLDLAEQAHPFSLVNK